MQIAGSAAVVTGGASRIGRGMCERFAALGAEHVVVADVNGDAAREVAESIGGTAVVCDVRDDASVQALVAESLSVMGRIDLFCANAGVGRGGGVDTDELTEERFLITPTAMSAEMFKAKAADWDGFHAQMRERLDEAGARHGA